MSGSVSNLQIYNVSSINRDPGSSDTDNFNYTFALPTSYLEMFTHVSVINWQFPKSYFTVRDPLNQFILDENGTQTTIQIPEGNYTNVQLFQAVADALTAVSAFSYTYTVIEVNTATLGQVPVPDLNQIQVITSAPGAIPISLIFDDNTSMMADLLGFLNGVNIINGPGGGSIAPNQYNLNPEACVYLISNIVNSVVNDNDFSNSTLAVLNIGQYPFGTYVAQSYDLIANMKPFNPLGNQFNFTLTTDNAYPSFFLNNVNMQFQIAFFKYTNNYNYYKKSILLQEAELQKY